MPQMKGDANDRPHTRRSFLPFQNCTYHTLADLACEQHAPDRKNRNLVHLVGEPDCEDETFDCIANDQINTQNTDPWAEHQQQAIDELWLLHYEQISLFRTSICMWTYDRGERDGLNCLKQDDLRHFRDQARTNIMGEIYFLVNNVFNGTDRIPAAFVPELLVLWDRLAENMQQVADNNDPHETLSSISDCNRRFTFDGQAPASWRLIVPEEHRPDAQRRAIDGAQISSYIAIPHLPFLSKPSAYFDKALCQEIWKCEDLIRVLRSDIKAYETTNHLASGPAPLDRFNEADFVPACFEERLHSTNDEIRARLAALDLDRDDCTLAHALKCHEQMLDGQKRQRAGTNPHFATDQHVDFSVLPSELRDNVYDWLLAGRDLTLYISRSDQNRCHLTCTTRYPRRDDSLCKGCMVARFKSDGEGGGISRAMKMIVGISTIWPELYHEQMDFLRRKADIKFLSRPCPCMPKPNPTLPWLMCASRLEVDLVGYDDTWTKRDFELAQAMLCGEPDAPTEELDS